MPARKPRADSERNRRLLLDAAKQIFAEKGASASLEEIARAAGVGIGTLYRHFPARQDLLQEVYRDESENLFEAAERLAATGEPVEALRSWLRLFVRYFTTKRLVLDALTALMGSEARLTGATGAQFEAAITLLAKGAEASGALRLTVAPIDLVRAIIGVSGTGAGPGWENAANAMIDILIAGMQGAQANEGE